MPKDIPKYVQVLNRVKIEDENLKEHLIKVYEVDGVLIDKEMARRNPKAKQLTPFITASKPKVMMSGAEEFGAKSEKMSNWVYCGDLYYVRKIGKEYHFAQYLKYDTELKETVGLWDQEEWNNS